MDDATIFSGLIIRALSHLEIVRVGYLAITYGVKSLLIFFFIFFIKSNPRLRGYGVTSLLIFLLQICGIKGCKVTKVTKVTGVTGVTMAIKGPPPHQIQGYEVTGLQAC